MYLNIVVNISSLFKQTEAFGIYRVVLSTNEGINQKVMRFTPFITPENQAVKKKVTPKTNSLGSSSLLREVYRFEKGKISHSAQS